MAASEYAVFDAPNFNAHAYANAVLAGSQSKSLAEPAKEDISVAISKLDLAIDDVTKQIKALVTAHHEDLLQRATHASTLSGSLAAVRRGLSDLESSIDTLRQKIHEPCAALHTHVARLQRLHQAHDALRRLARFAVLAKRLEAQMAELGGEPDDREAVAKAALSIAELGALLDPEGAAVSVDGRAGAESVPLRAVRAAAAYVPLIADARTRVHAAMEAMVLRALADLDQSLLASALQTAYHLRALLPLVTRFVRDLNEAVEERIQNAFDISRISKEVVAKEPPQASQGLLYKSRVRTEPTNVTAPQFAAALWTRLGSLNEDMAGCCVKVYTFEKVLHLKKDPLSGISFLDEALKVLDSKPSTLFWASLSKSLERYARDAAKGSSFLQQTLSSGYPKLLRLVHEFFASIAVHTDTIYTPSYQSPETILILRALSTFESLYVSRSSTRMNEAVAQAFSGGSRTPPGANEGINIVRIVTNELDSARFDPLLIRTIAKHAATSLESVATRADGLAVSDRSAVSLLGPMATPQQVLNAQVAMCLYHCWTKLEQLIDGHEESISTIIEPSVTKIRTRYDQFVEPLLTAIKKELSGIISRLHRLDLQKSMDPASGISSSSLYMKDLVDKLSFVKTGLLNLYAPEIAQPWASTIVKDVIRTFLLHASIATPLGESGKLQLTTDMTELEFSLNAFLADGSQGKRGGGLERVGDEYRALRAMRPLLFLDTALLASAERTAGLAPLVVLHHILVRSPMVLPHVLHGWQEATYVRWVEAHAPEEAWVLVEGCVAQWEARGEEGGEEYVDLARAVLRAARGPSG